MMQEENAQIKRTNKVMKQVDHSKKNGKNVKGYKYVGYFWEDRPMSGLGLSFSSSVGIWAEHSARLRTLVYNGINCMLHKHNNHLKMPEKKRKTKKDKNKISEQKAVSGIKGE